MNVAHWTPSPSMELDIADEKRRLAKTRRMNLAGVAFLAVSLPFWGLMFLVGAVVQPVLAPFAAAFFFGSLWLGGRMVAPGPSIDIAREFAGGDRSGWLVALLVHQGDAPMGSDQGMLWIEDDRLYFAGRRTSFGLTADQADGFLRFDPATPGVRYDFELRLNHQTPAGPLGISFSQIDSGGRIVESHREILDRVNRWIGRGGGTGGQLPPLDFGPDAPTLPLLSWRAGAAVAFWLLLLGSFPVLIVLGHAVLAVVTAFVGLLAGSLWSSVWSPHLRLKAWMDRRRLSGGKG